MILLVDSREQAPLEFPTVAGVTVRVEALPVGDYGALGDRSVIERKSVADCFTAFAGGYEREKAKLLKAKALGLTYVLAIEASFSEVLKGHSYWKDGQVRESRKSGLSQIRQLCTWERKYGVPIWYCTSRKEMAFRILEYFLAGTRGRYITDTLKEGHPKEEQHECTPGK